MAKISLPADTRLAKDSSLTCNPISPDPSLIPAVFEENRNTFDLEVQHSFRSGQHDIVYGANYRLSHDDIGNLGPVLAFLPDEKTVHLISAYAQDEWHLVPEKFSITGGSKFEYNSFSGFEVQPTGRFTWLPGSGQTVWGAISRAVRTPTRIDQDLVGAESLDGRSSGSGGQSQFRFGSSHRLRTGLPDQAGQQRLVRCRRFL